MQKQILNDSEWVDGEPTIEGQEFRFKIPVGNGFGFQRQKHTLMPASNRRTKVAMDELVLLMGLGPYTNIYRAAYSDVSVPTQDGRALYFFESRRYLVGQSIDVNDSGMDAELNDFITSGYLTEADKARITQGVEV